MPNAAPHCDGTIDALPHSRRGARGARGARLPRGGGGGCSLGAARAPRGDAAARRERLARRDALLRRAHEAERRGDGAAADRLRVQALLP